MSACHGDARDWRALSDRAHIVLLVAEVLINVEIRKALGVTDQTA